MAMLPEDVKAGAGIVAPRVSTPEPVGVPRWEDDATLDIPQFQMGTFAQPKPQGEPLQKLTLGLDALTPLSLGGLSSRMSKAEDWRTDYAPIPEYKPGKIQGAPTPDGRPVAATSGGLGPGAYGWSGMTGGKGTKGSAAYGLQTQFWAAIQAANAAMKSAGLGQVSVTSGWRDYNRQVSLKKEKGKWAATPGRSVHGIGLAADLAFASPAQKAWIHRNAARFGLVFLPSEDWHVQLDPGVWKGW